MSEAASDVGNQSSPKKSWLEISPALIHPRQLIIAGTQNAPSQLDSFSLRKRHTVNLTGFGLGVIHRESGGLSANLIVVDGFGIVQSHECTLSDIRLKIN